MPRVDRVSLAALGSSVVAFVIRNKVTALLTALLCCLAVPVGWKAVVHYPQRTWNLLSGARPVHSIIAMHKASSSEAGAVASRTDLHPSGGNDRGKRSAPTAVTARRVS